MGSREKDDADREREIERYREAAVLALDNLQACINYLYRIRKGNVARALERNHARIRDESPLHR